MQVSDAIFHSPTSGRLTMEEVTTVIESFIDALPGHPHKIIVGSDSSARETTTITTAIIVQRVGRGARCFYTRSSAKRYATLRERIFAEAMSSITLAQELRSSLKDKLGEEFVSGQNEIHVDIGHNGPTKELVEAVTGMLRGFDFIPVIKPESYAAFVVADKYT